MERVRPHPLKGKFRRSLEVVIESGLSGPIHVIQRGRHRVIRLSAKHREFDWRLILGMLGDEWLEELSSKAFAYCDSGPRAATKPKVGWKPISIALKDGRPEVKVEFVSRFQKTIKLRKRPKHF